MNLKAAHPELFEDGLVFGFVGLRARRVREHMQPSSRTVTDGVRVSICNRLLAGLLRLMQLSVEPFNPVVAFSFQPVSHANRVTDTAELRHMPLHSGDVEAVSH
jgi:hypothetical protein